jgi:hypothetical protein
MAITAGSVYDAGFGLELRSHGGDQPIKYL